MTPFLLIQHPCSFHSLDYKRKEGGADKEVQGREWWVRAVSVALPHFLFFSSFQFIFQFGEWEADQKDRGGKSMPICLLR